MTARVYVDLVEGITIYPDPCMNDDSRPPMR